MKTKEKAFVKIVAAMGLIGIGAGAMYLANYKKINFINRYPEFLEVDEYTKDTLEIDVPKNPDKKTLAEAYYKLYNDKYTFVEESLSPESKEYALKKVNDSSTAKESGFKIKFNEKNQPYFSAIVKGLPADKQGIKIGDVIKNVDDFEVTEYKHAIRLVGGDDITVKLILERNGKDFEIDFVRSSDDEKMSGVSAEMYGETLYVSVRNMEREAVSEFIKLLSENEFKSIIIDLRENNGGYTQTAIAMADLFIGASETFMHAQNDANSVIYTTDDEIVYDAPITVLINENTMSAAEILTALLKQYGDAKLVGTNTFGKGIFQNVGLYYGESVRYTEGYYTVGDWECYHGVGIKPDIEIDMDSDYIGTEYDVQLEKALELVK